MGINNYPMKYLSVCSGIEAATAAWHDLEFDPVGFSEIEDFPSAVLAHHYPGVPNFGDMTKYKEWKIDGVDVLVGGTPCQAFSVAGLRKSLADDRGNLSLVFCGIADHFNPGFVLWENVPGVLNTKDNAFGCFLAGLAGEDDPLVAPGGRWTNAGYVLGPERTVAWRVLDAQYFGVAQRRRRVFVVACPRNGTDPREVLFERGGVRRDTPLSREKRKRTPGNVETDFNFPINSTGYQGDVVYDSSMCGPCLSAQGGNNGGGPGFILHHQGILRRLTPRECERLQGFPENYTNIPYGRPKYAGQICPDGHRYKAIGNSMAVPVMRWIGKRIAALR